MGPRDRLSPLVATLFVALSLVGCEGDAAAPRSVLLVTIDTLRFDRLSGPTPMPALRAMADRSVEFRQARATVPMTLPSHATVMTGTTSDVHGVRDNVGYALGPSLPTVAESFAGAGYATAAFVGGYPLVRAFGLDRGFGTYDDRLDRAVGGLESGHVERRAADVLEAAEAWIRDHEGARFFVWVHLYDLHEPYEPPAPFGDTVPAYDGEAAYVDACLGAFFDRLAAANIEPSIVVTSDHGESLDEHGERTHGVFVYDSTLRVPLILRHTDETRHAVVDEPVSLADVAPTLLDLAGLPGLERATGRSLLPLLEGSRRQAIDPSAVYIESLHGRQRYGWAELSGFVDWPWKFIEAPAPELYDLSDDPFETRNLIDETRLATQRSRLNELRRRPEGPTHPHAENLKVLESLGYLGARSTAPQDTGAVHVDPKEVIGVLPAVERGLGELADQRFESAEREFLAVLEQDPTNLVALNNLGIIALRHERTADAIERFEQGLAHDPTSDHLANNLGLALSRAGRLDEAERAYRRALASNPRFDAARFNLALVLHHAGRNAEALTELERFAAAHPEDSKIEPVRQAIRKGMGAVPPGS